MPLPRQSFRVPSTDGVQLCVNAWPREGEADDDLPIVVLVHPYTVMGGCQALMKGMAKALNKLGFE